MSDELERRLAKSGATLDAAIELHRAGARLSPERRHGRAHRLLSVSAAAGIIAIGVGMIPILRNASDSGRTGSGDGVVAGSVASSPGSAQQTNGESAAGDAHVYAALNTVLALAPYGPAGDHVYYNILDYKRWTCMAEAGHEYHRVPFSERWTADSNAMALTHPLPAHNAVFADGYQAFVTTQVEGTSTATQAASAANEAMLDADPTWAQAMMGDASDPGCAGRAEQFLEDRMSLDAVAQYRALLPSLEPVFIPDVSQDEPLRSATRLWSACMALSGFEYAEPLDPMNEFDRPLGTEPSEGEVHIAIVDLDCREASNYRAEYLGALVSRLAYWLDNNESAVAQLVATTRHEIEELQALAAELGLDE